MCFKNLFNQFVSTANMDEEIYDDAEAGLPVSPEKKMLIISNNRSTSPEASKPPTSQTSPTQPNVESVGMSLKERMALLTSSNVSFLLSGVLCRDHVCCGGCE